MKEDLPELLSDLLFYSKDEDPNKWKRNFFIGLIVTILIALIFILINHYK